VKLVHLVGFIIKKFVTMHGHMNKKKKTWVRYSGNEYIFTLGMYSQGQELCAHFRYFIVTPLTRVRGQERLLPVSVLTAIPCIYMCLYVGKWTLVQESIMSINNKLTFHCNVYVGVCMCHACT